MAFVASIVRLIIIKSIMNEMPHNTPKKKVLSIIVKLLTLDQPNQMKYTTGRAHVTRQIPHNT